jgi:sRNA-binding carbon storage regulator CsrA
VDEGFYVGDEQFAVRSIESTSKFVLERKKDGVLFTVVEGRSVEILSGVSVTQGIRAQADLARVAIEAPRSVRILRWDHYLAEQEKKKP